MNVGEVVAAISGTLIALLLMCLYRRRQAVIYHGQHAFRALVYALAICGAFYMSTPLIQPQYQMIGAYTITPIAVAVWCVIYFRKPPRPSTIPKPVRRQVIAKFENETGQPYDSTFYDIHHVVPFSKGGSHTPDNLQVIPRDVNRSNGSKGEWWDVVRWFQHR